MEKDVLSRNIYVYLNKVKIYVIKVNKFLNKFVYYSIIIFLNKCKFLIYLF